MKRYQPYIVLGAAGFMALLTSLLVFNWLGRLEPRKQEVVKLQTRLVAVAAQDKPWGTLLTPEMLKLVPFPQESLPQGHFAALEPLAGRVLLAMVTTNEPILESKLAPIEMKTGGVAAVTDPQKRAMAVKVDDVVGVAGFINPGHKVDVLVTLSQDPPVTKIVLQNVLVLATGSEVERKGKGQEPIQVKVITLEVTPQEAEKLALASTEGKLRLALRNQLNAEPVLTKGETLSSLLSSYSLRESAKKNGKGREAKVEEPKVEVEVIRVDKVSTLTFKEPGKANGAGSKGAPSQNGTREKPRAISNVEHTTAGTGPKDAPSETGAQEQPRAISNAEHTAEHTTTDKQVEEQGG